MSPLLKRCLALWFGTILIIALLTCMSGCAKRPMATATEITDKAVIESHDSDKTTDRSKEILDSLKMYIAKIQTTKPECDSVCQIAVDHLLEQLNLQKISGDNSYSLLYDKYTRLLTFAAKIGETKNEKTVVTNLKTVTTTYNITKIEPVKYIPEFWRYSAYLGWVFAAYLINRIYIKARSWMVKSIIT